MVGLGRTQATLDEVNKARELAPRLSELFKRDTSGESRGAKISAAVAAGTPLAEARKMSKAELDEAAKEGYAINGAHAQRPRTTLDAPPPTAHLRLSPAHRGPTCTPEPRSSPRLPRARPSAVPRLPSLASALEVVSRALSLSPSPRPSPPRLTDAQPHRKFALGWQQALLAIDLQRRCRTRDTPQRSEILQYLNQML